MPPRQTPTWADLRSRRRGQEVGCELAGATQVPRPSTWQPTNRLLAALGPDDLGRLGACAQAVALSAGQMLQEPHARADYVDFIEAGLVSLPVQPGADPPIEVGLVGRSGLIGLPVLFETAGWPIGAMVQVAGQALRVETADLHRAIGCSPPLRRALLAHAHVMMVQGAQLVLCGTRHPIEGRVARWLLLAHDHLEADAVPVTHDRLSRARGVRRASVTEALHRLETAGAIQVERGRIRVADGGALEALACGCYHAMKREEDRLLEPAQGEGGS